MDTKTRSSPEVRQRAGYRKPDDSPHFVGSWDKDLRIAGFRRLFVANQLRQKEAHRIGGGLAASLAANLEVFGIAAAAQAGG